ncbi:hypothetical protein KTT_28150 [Tengunoibacter tsumagoiensis]|uniref:Uncharacterized protein n=1 Tax=Tengunoibacter tsumagoiensis TaxID=2014871 RepID=A0A402A1M2_9CHLR|nr:hypothetical protein KTT_28150 [Tengunoibacter tsumagoiensis]
MGTLSGRDCGLVPVRGDNELSESRNHFSVADDTGQTAVTPEKLPDAVFSFSLSSFQCENLFGHQRANLELKSPVSFLSLCFTQEAPPWHLFLSFLSPCFTL